MLLPSPRYKQRVSKLHLPIGRFLVARNGSGTQKWPVNSSTLTSLEEAFASSKRQKMAEKKR